MINFHDFTNENKTKHNPKDPYIQYHPYIKLITGGFGSGKANALLRLINNQRDIDQMHLYPKDPGKEKYQYLVNKHEKVGLKNYGDPKFFIEYSNDMQDFYKNIEEYTI